MFDEVLFVPAMQEPLIEIPQKLIKDEDDPLYIDPSAESSYEVAKINQFPEDISCDVDPFGIIPGENSKGNRYSCRDCSYSTEIWDFFIKHLANCKPKVDKEKLFKCLYCSFQTKLREVYRTHSKIHAVGNICSICRYDSPTKPKLQEHVLSHTNKFSFQCILCKERLINNKTFDNHMKEHICQTSKCYWCTFTSDQSMRLRQHLQIHIESLKKYCQECGYYCFSEKDKKSHEEVHENIDENKFKEKNSEYSLKKSSLVLKDEAKIDCEKNLKKTLSIPFNRLLHNKVKGFYKCTICDTLQTSEEELMIHSKSHMSSIIYNCPTCGYSTNLKENIRSHVVNHLPLVEMTDFE